MALYSVPSLLKNAVSPDAIMSCFATTSGAPPENIVCANAASSIYATAVVGPKTMPGVGSDPVFPPEPSTNLVA